MMKHLARIEPQRMTLFAGGIVLLIGATLAAYLVMPQYRAHRAALQEQAALQRVVDTARNVEAEQARLEAEVERLDAELRDNEDALPQQALEAFVIGRLQEISWRRQIELIAVEPSQGTQIGPVQETLFELELAGEYENFHGWLRDLHGELDSVAVRNLSLAPLESKGSDPRLHAGLVVAAYRSVE